MKSLFLAVALGLLPLAQLPAQVVHGKPTDTLSVNIGLAAIPGVLSGESFNLFCEPDAVTTISRETTRNGVYEGYSIQLTPHMSVDNGQDQTIKVSVSSTLEAPEHPGVYKKKTTESVVLLHQVGSVWLGEYRVPSQPIVLKIGAAFPL